MKDKIKYKRELKKPVKTLETSALAAKSSAVLSDVNKKFRDAIGYFLFLLTREASAPNSNKSFAVEAFPPPVALI